MPSFRYKSYIYLLLAEIIWGIAGPVIKFTLGGLDPLPFLTYRFTISAILSLIFFAYKINKGKKFRRLRANFKMAVVYGLLAAPIALGILFVGLDNSTILDLTLIGVIGPMMVTAGGALFFHDHITHREKIGISVLLLGVVVNSFLPIFKSGSGVRLTANLLLVVYLLADSSSTLIAKRTVQKKVKSSNLTNLAFIVGAATLLPLTILTYGGNNFVNMLVGLPLKYHLGVWYMAVLSGSAGYFLYIRAQRSIEVSEAVLFNYLQPVIMVPLAIFWLGESLSIHFILGAIIITLGLIIAEYKRRPNSNIAK